MLHLATFPYTICLVLNAGTMTQVHMIWPSRDLGMLPCVSQTQLCMADSSIIHSVTTYKRNRTERATMPKNLTVPELHQLWPNRFYCTLVMPHEQKGPVVPTNCVIPTHRPYKHTHLK